MNSIALILDECLYDPLCKLPNRPLKQTVDLCKSYSIMPAIISRYPGLSSPGTILHQPTVDCMTASQCILSADRIWMDHTIILFGGVRYAPEIWQDHPVVTSFDYIATCAESPRWLINSGTVEAIVLLRRDFSKFTGWLKAGYHKDNPDPLFVPMP